MNLSGICPLTTHEALQRAAITTPDVEAIVTPNERVTYRELTDRVDTIRGALIASGVTRGDHVAICVGNGSMWLALFLALGSLGAVSVPINTRLKSDEVGYQLRQSRSKVLFLADRLLDKDYVDLLRHCCPGIDSTLPDPTLPDLHTVVVIGDDVPAAAQPWANFIHSGAAQSQAHCTPDDILLIQYTSGSTARPKGVLLTHRHMCANGFFSGSRVGLRAGDRFYSARPFFHVAGTTLSILSCIQHLATLVTMERFQAGSALQLMEAENCTHFSGNDTIALMLLGHPDRQQRNLSLRGAWVAAAPTVVRRVIDELGASECVVGYGLSEASPNVAQSAWWEDEETRISGRMLPEPGVDVDIKDVVTGDRCPQGETGEILVRGWNVMQGYFDQPSQTAESLSPDGWLSTGDLGRLDQSGRLEYVGRCKELIRVGGENVAPAEVEDVLHRHPDIRQAAVVGVSDDRLVQVPVAFVVLVDGAELEPDVIIEWARDRLAQFKVPRHVEVIADFADIAMTASSKVPKQALTEYAEQLRAART